MRIDCGGGGCFFFFFWVKRERYIEEKREISMGEERVGKEDRKKVRNE